MSVLLSLATIEAGCQNSSPASLVRSPSVEIAAGSARAIVQTPDAVNGRYRGQRFDWSGMISRLTVGRHTYFGPWRHGDGDPLSHDATAIGTADEFGMLNPPGFADPASDTFVKIGVGRFRKLSGSDYVFNGNYTLVNRPKWSTDAGRNWVECLQTLQPAGDGVGYRYRKRITIESHRGRNGAETCRVSITRTLENIGRKPIRTDQYTHNFLSIDDLPVDERYGFEASFGLHAAEPRDLHGLVELKSREAAFLGPIPSSSTAYAEFVDLPAGVESAKHTVVVQHVGGGRVRLGVSEKLIGVHLYCVQKAICPELFVAVEVDPGQTMEWTSTYDFDG